MTKSKEFYYKVPIKRGTVFKVGQHLLERHRFRQYPDTINKIVSINVDKNHMVLEDVATGLRVNADIDCHHSQGSRYTWLTYSLPNMDLIYGQED